MKTINIEDESPYCDVCGTCGYIGCCGIRNFISEHIKGKTNCKNEDLIISELIDLCDYKDKVFEENDKLKQQLKEKDKEIERLNNIIKPKEVNYKYLKLLFEKKDKEEVIKSYVYKCEQLEKLYKSYEEKEIEVMKKDNIIDELEKELEQNIAVNKVNNIEQPDNPEWYIKWNCYSNILDRIKELKEGK